MNRFFESLAWSVATIILAMGIITAIFWPQRTIWPSFPSGSDSAPQVVAHVDRDFGWRTGDAVPVTFYIKQPSSVKVDIDNISFSGDFESQEQPGRLVVRDTKSGVRYICITLTVQSFNVQPKWTLEGAVPYTLQGQTEPKTVDVPKLELYTSPTWDRRPDLQDGPMTVVAGYHWLITGGCLFLGFWGLVASWVYERRRAAMERGELDHLLSPREIARRDFKAVWAKIAAGDDSVDNYRELQQIVRKLFRCQTEAMGEFLLVMGINHPYTQDVRVILEHTNKVLYGQTTLGDPEKREVYDAFNQILKARKST